MSIRRYLSLTALTLSLLIGLVPAVVAQDERDIELVQMDIPLQGVSSLVPDGWNEVAAGTFTREDSPQDRTLFAVQSLPASVDILWPSLLNQLRLEEIPEPSATIPGEPFEWTVYTIGVDGPGGSVTVHLAIAGSDSLTNIVVLQSSPEEAADLYDRIFLPVLASVTTLAPVRSFDPATARYTAEEVGFPGGDPGVELAGTLTIPDGDGPHPAVVLLTGSKGNDRDESLRPLTEFAPFALIADGLSSAGFAVLRFDDRGIASSTGDFAAASIEDFTDDARAAMDYLETREEIDAERMGFLGHSEGGIYAADIAADDPRVAFVIGMAAPAVDGLSILVEQTGPLLRAEGASDEDVLRATELNESLYRSTYAGDLEAVRTRLGEAAGEAWDRASDEERQRLGEREAFIEQTVRTEMPVFETPWLQSLLRTDVAADWQQITVPVLGLFAGRDRQLVTETNEAALRAALSSAGNEDVKITTFPTANHLFQDAVTGSASEYAELASEFVPEFLPTIVDWLSARFLTER